MTPAVLEGSGVLTAQDEVEALLTGPGVPVAIGHLLSFETLADLDVLYVGLVLADLGGGDGQVPRLMDLKRPGHVDVTEGGWMDDAMAVVDLGIETGTPTLVSGTRIR